MWERFEGLVAKKTLVRSSVPSSLVGLIHERVVIEWVLFVSIRPSDALAVGDDAVDVRLDDHSVDVSPRHTAGAASALSVCDQGRERHESGGASTHGTDEAFGLVLGRSQVLAEVVGALEIAGAWYAVVVHVDPVLVEVHRRGNVHVTYTAPIMHSLLMFFETFHVIEVLLAFLAKVVGGRVDSVLAARRVRGEVSIARSTIRMPCFVVLDEARLSLEKPLTGIAVKVIGHSVRLETFLGILKDTALDAEEVLLHVVLLEFLLIIELLITCFTVIMGRMIDPMLSSCLDGVEIAVAGEAPDMRARVVQMCVQRLAVDERSVAVPALPVARPFLISNWHTDANSSLRTSRTRRSR
jgi:hypothetical protein